PAGHSRRIRGEDPALEVACQYLINPAWFTPTARLPISSFAPSPDPYYNDQSVENVTQSKVFRIPLWSASTDTTIVVFEKCRCPTLRAISMSEESLRTGCYPNAGPLDPVVNQQPVAAYSFHGILRERSGPRVLAKDTGKRGKSYSLHHFPK